VETLEHVIAQGLPEALRMFMRENCRLPAQAFHPLPPGSLPQPARRLLAHEQDMTSTLATFHESPLRVEVLQAQRSNDLYLREVFLRTTVADAIVEYGVIAIALEQFSPSEQELIQAGQTPLGALLHRSKIPFESAPIGFFSVSGRSLARTPLHTAADVTCYGRFNRLTKSTGEPLAWILEILPHSTT
jgi:chorismate-pyruvate lyase